MLLSMEGLLLKGYCISLNNTWRRLFKGRNYSRVAVISNIAHWKLCPKYFVLVYTKTVDSVFRTL